jgi:hypothetical protein
MRRFRVAPVIDVGLHHATGTINVVTIETGAMLFVLTDDVKATNRSAVPFAATGYPRCRAYIPPAVKIGFLRT